MLEPSDEVSLVASGRITIPPEQSVDAQKILRVVRGSYDAETLDGYVLATGCCYDRDSLPP